VRLGAVGGHVGVPAEGALALGLGGFEHRGGIGVLEQHVGAAVDQAGGGFGFFRWVEPAVHPHHFGLDLGVARLGAEREGVDVADDFRDRDGADHTQRIGLGHLAGNHARHVRAFIGAAVVGAHVLKLLVAGGVFELDTGVVSRHLEHGLHVTKSGAKNQLVALAGHVAQHALGVGRLGHVFHEGGGDLVAKFLFQRLATIVMGKGPAPVANRADIGKGNFQGLGFGRFRSHRRGCGRRRGLFLLAAAHQRSCGHGGESGCLEQRAFLQVGHVISL